MSCAVIVPLYVHNAFAYIFVQRSHVSSLHMLLACLLHHARQTSWTERETRQKYIYSLGVQLRPPSSFMAGKPLQLLEALALAHDQAHLQQPPQLAKGPG